MCLEKLEGHGCLEFDLEMAQREEQILQRQLALVQQKLRQYEDKIRCEDFFRGDFHVSISLDDVIVTYIEDVWLEF